MSDTQLDLFGDVERAEAERDRKAEQRRAWYASFERADWIAPYDCQDGTKAGEAISGWRCPDPDCGEVEPSAFSLSINHGFDPTVPGRQTWDGRCIKLQLLANQARYDREHP
jgi:hypothetical protein